MRADYERLHWQDVVVRISTTIHKETVSRFDMGRFWLVSTCWAILIADIFPLSAADAARAPSGNQLQIAVLHAQLQRDLDELALNQSMLQRSDTTETQKDQLRSRAIALNQEIAALRAQMGSLSK